MVNETLKGKEIKYLQCEKCNSNMKFMYDFEEVRKQADEAFSNVFQKENKMKWLLDQFGFVGCPICGNSYQLTRTAVVKLYAKVLKGK